METACEAPVLVAGGDADQQLLGVEAALPQPSQILVSPRG